MSAYLTNYMGYMPAEVRYNRSLSADAKLLYCEITAGLDATGLCRVKASDLEQMYGVSRASINRWLSELEDAKMIVFEGSSRDPRGRAIRLKKEVSDKIGKARTKASKADNLIINEQVDDSLRKTAQVELNLIKNEQVDGLLNQICASTPIYTTNKPLCISPKEATTNFELNNPEQPAIDGPASHFRVPSLKDVLEYAKMKGVNPKVAEGFWFKQESLGWMSGVTPIKKWQPLLHSWQLNKFEPSSGGRYAPPVDLVPIRPEIKITPEDNQLMDEAYEAVRKSRLQKFGGSHVR